MLNNKIENYRLFLYNCMLKCIYENRICDRK